MKKSSDGFRDAGAIPTIQSIFPEPSASVEICQIEGENRVFSEKGRLLLCALIRISNYGKDSLRIVASRLTKLWDEEEEEAILLPDPRKTKGKDFYDYGRMIVERADVINHLIMPGAYMPRDFRISGLLLAPLEYAPTSNVHPVLELRLQIVFNNGMQVDAILKLANKKVQRPNAQALAVMKKNRVPLFRESSPVQTQTGGVGGTPNNAALPATPSVDYVKVTQP